MSLKARESYSPTDMASAMCLIQEARAERDEARTEAETLKAERDAHIRGAEALHADNKKLREERDAAVKKLDSQSLKISRYRVAVRNAEKVIADRRKTLKSKRYENLLTVVEALTWKCGQVLGDAKPFTWIRMDNREDYFKWKEWDDVRRREEKGGE